MSQRWFAWPGGCLLVFIFVLSVVSGPMVRASDDSKQDSRFYAREYMSETEALSYQKESKSDRVKVRQIRLNKEEVQTVRKRQRVTMYTDKYRIMELYKKGADEPYRYVLPIQETGQHEFMDLMYGVNKDGTIHRIDLLVYREPYGSEVESRRFMRQFEGRSLEDSKFRVNLDVIHIAGATISAHSVARGTRRVLEILRLRDMIP